MPRDGSGVYTLPAGNPVVTNTIIASAWANSTMSDIAAQLNNVLTRDGLLGPTGPFKLQDGTVAAPGLAFASEAGLGMYRQGAGVISWAAGGLRAFSFQAADPANSYIVAQPRAAGSSYLQMWSDPAPQANTDYFTVRKFTDGTHFVSAVIGTGTPKPFFFEGAPYYRADNILNSATQLSMGVVANPDWKVVKEATVIRQYYNNSVTHRFDYDTSTGNFAIVTDGGSFGFDNASTFQSPGMVRSSGGNGPTLRFDGGTATLVHMSSILTGPWSWQWLSTTGLLSWMGNASATLVQFDSSGNAYKSSGAGSWAAVSDRRFKDVHEDYKAGLNEVLQIVPKWYAYKDTPDDRRVSPIAQDIQPVMPDTITVGHQKRGDIEHDDALSFDMTNITYALVNAIKELNDRLHHLELQAG